VPERPPVLRPLPISFQLWRGLPALLRAAQDQARQDVRDLLHPGVNAGRRWPTRCAIDHLDPYAYISLLACGPTSGLPACQFYLWSHHRSERRNPYPCQCVCITQKAASSADWQDPQSAVGYALPAAVCPSDSGRGAPATGRQGANSGDAFKCLAAQCSVGWTDKADWSVHHKAQAAHSDSAPLFLQGPVP
jgi:hypothetical protein